jgi:hypothetical protein
MSMAPHVTLLRRRRQGNSPCAARAGERAGLQRLGSVLRVAAPPRPLARSHRFPLMDGGLPNEQMPSDLGR